MIKIAAIGKAQEQRMPRETIKLFEFIPSPNCERVKVVLEEKKLPYESVLVNIRNGEQKSQSIWL